MSDWSDELYVGTERGVHKVRTLRRREATERVKKLLRAGMMPVRMWCGTAPTERLKLRRQMAAAGGKHSTTSLSLFMEAFGLAVEEFSTLATQYWADEQKDAWMNQIFEVQTWREVRGPSGAVMCETKDLGMKWPHRHTHVFEGDRRKT